MQQDVRIDIAVHDADRDLHPGHSDEFIVGQRVVSQVPVAVMQKLMTTVGAAQIAAQHLDHKVGLQKLTEALGRHAIRHQGLLG